MLERQPYNAAGQCKATGEYVFDVLTSHNRESPLAGRSVTIGDPHDNAECCWFLRTDGSLMQITICTEALDDGLDLVALHNEVIAGLVWETIDANRLLIGTAPMTDKQREASLQTTLSMFNAPFISLFTRQRWIDVNLREKVIGHA